MDTYGATIIPDYTLEQLLEEGALFILQRALQTILTTDLFEDVAVDSKWRRRLKSGASR